MSVDDRINEFSSRVGLKTAREQREHNELVGVVQKLESRLVNEEGRNADFQAQLQKKTDNQDTSIGDMRANLQQHSESIQGLFSHLRVLEAVALEVRRPVPPIHSLLIFLVVSPGRRCLNCA